MQSCPQTLKLSLLPTLPGSTLHAYDAAFMSPRTSPRQANLREKAQLMFAPEIERTLVRLVHEIIEKNIGSGLQPLKFSGKP